MFRGCIVLYISKPGRVYGDECGVSLHSRCLGRTSPAFVQKLRGTTTKKETDHFPRLRHITGTPTARERRQACSPFTASLATSTHSSHGISSGAKTFAGGTASTAVHPQEERFFTHKLYTSTTNGLNTLPQILSPRPPAPR